MDVTKRRSLCVLGLFLVCLLGFGAAGPAMAEEAKAQDPVIQEIVRMLTAEISEPVIVRWIETSGRRPAAVSSHDLVALKQAGASDDLLGKLLEMAGSEPPPPPAPSPLPDAPTPTPMRAPEPPPSPAEPSGAVPMRFEVRYQPVSVEDEEPWDLFVYLDGRLLARAEAPMAALFPRTVTFEGRVEPGPHVLRVVQERHRRRSGGWYHEARVSEEPVLFTLEPETPGELKLEFRQVKLALGAGDAPLSWRVTQGERTAAESGPAGTRPETWPPLCEEIEANLERGKRPALPIRRELERCVRWTGLWPGIAGVPSREEVRAELARYDFRPVPAER